MATLRTEHVIDVWHGVVKNAAGKDQYVLEKTEQAIKNASAPNVVCQREQVTTGLFGEKRDFLMVTNKVLREYAMFIGARNYGKDLDCIWFMTVNPGFLKRALSKHLAAGNPTALSMSLNMFAQQDLAAYKQLAHQCLQEVIQELMESLHLDYSIVDRRSKGFLSVW
jgi:hypothetical protein